VKMPRRHASLLIQNLTCPSEQTLDRIGKVQSPACPACRGADEGEPTQQLFF
jgi:hypothetical protein